MKNIFLILIFCQIYFFQEEFFKGNEIINFASKKTDLKIERIIDYSIDYLVDIKRQENISEIQNFFNTKNNNEDENLLILCSKIKQNLMQTKPQVLKELYDIVLNSQFKQEEIFRIIDLGLDFKIDEYVYYLKKQIIGLKNYGQFMKDQKNEFLKENCQNKNCEKIFNFILTFFENKIEKISIKKLIFQENLKLMKNLITDFYFPKFHYKNKEPKSVQKIQKELEKLKEKINNYIYQQIIKNQIKKIFFKNSYFKQFKQNFRQINNTMDKEQVLYCLEKEIENMFSKKLFTLDQKDNLLLACKLQIPEISQMVEEIQNKQNKNQNTFENLIYSQAEQIIYQIQNNHQQQLEQIKFYQGKTAKNQSNVSSRESSPQGVNLLQKKFQQDSTKPSLLSFKIKLQQGQAMHKDS